MATNTSERNLKDKISKDYDKLNDSEKFAIVIVGSGYGGSITASRMARTGQKVCVLERGLEIRPGEYPSNLQGIQQQSQIHTDSRPGERIGNATSLFDLRVNEDVSALVGCGLGGTSLINANVSLELNEKIFHRDGLEWPKVFRDNPKILDEYYKLAREGLGANPYPKPDDKNNPGYKSLNKFAALSKSADALGVEIIRPDINVTFNQDRDNHFGFAQTKCNLCGDCCSGCNVGAKNTTLMNYLPDAFHNDADLFCDTSVDYIEKSGDCWLIHVSETSDTKSANKTIKADVLILAAGTLGSTEIMLRSKAKGLTCSDKLGDNFSGNGDAIAFGYNSYWKDNDAHSDELLRAADTPKYEPVYGIGMGDNRLSEAQMPGPCITGLIDLRDNNTHIDQQLVIEEGVAPGAFSGVASAMLFFGAAQNANFLRYGSNQAQSRLEDIQELASTIQNNPTELNSLAYQGAVSRTQSYLIMSMDESVGTLKLKTDQLVIDWPNAGKSKAIKNDMNVIARANDAVQGQLLNNPLWNDALGNKLITVHPVGGCRMADKHSAGVVNDKCQVFDCDKKSSVHKGLYICDGSVLPGAVGVNPLLTISAIAERCSVLIAEKRGWTIDYDSRPTKTLPSEKQLSTQKEDNETYPDPWPDLGKQSTLSLFSIASMGALANQVTQDRINENHDSYPTDKERVLWQLQTHTGSTLLDIYDDVYKTSFEFTETMTGYIATTNNHNTEPTLIKKDYQRAFSFGKYEGESLTLSLIIKAPELNKLIKDREYTCDVTGCIKMSKQKFKIESGTFQLLTADNNIVEQWLMKYELNFIGVENKQFTLLGKKTLHCTEGSSWWTDLTELYVDIVDKDKNRVQSGIVSLNLQDLIWQISTFKAELDNGKIKELLGSRLYWYINQYYLEGLKLLKSNIGMYYVAKLMGSLSETVFRSYGGLLANLANYPKQEAKQTPPSRLIPTQVFSDVKTTDGFTIKLTLYKARPENKNMNNLPVILGPGMGVNASSFATETVDCNLVDFLIEKGRDVWLLDYRASADSGSSRRPFTIDDIARYDWPRAIDLVLKESAAPKVQIVAHCVSSMSLLMGLIGKFIDKEKIQSIISSQLTLHPVTNWLNNAKSDIDIINDFEALPLIQKMGNVIDMNSGTTGVDRIFDIMSYQIPTPRGEECNNPSCHRILATYGPSYLHAQLNRDTHNQIMNWFGPINLEPFKQMAHIIRKGYAVDADGKNTYLKNIATPSSDAPSNTIEQLDLPIVFMAGELNLEFLPQTSDRTYEWLKAHNPLSSHKYDRHIFEGYGHMDCFIGKDAHKGIFPMIDKWLNQHNGCK